MRLTTVLLIASLMQVSAAGLAQKINLSKSNAPLKMVLKDIRIQSGYVFLYNESQIRNAKPVNIKVTDADFQEVLKQIFADQSLTYSINEKTIIIKEKDPSFFDRLMDRFADIDIKGRVVDESGQALSGATVAIKGTNRSVVTGQKGEFALNNVAETATLVISYVGYKTREVTASLAASIVVVLEAGMSDLQEVSVVSTGYQNIPKERATGSFELVDNKTLNLVTGTNILKRLQGNVTGFDFNNQKFATSSSNPVKPGVLSYLTIRGQNTLYGSSTSGSRVLVVVDGIEMVDNGSIYTENQIGKLNPNDIENITILRDAAAVSVYGSRASNGVIVITTKKGKFDQPLEVSFNANATITEKPDLFYIKRISTAEFIDVQKVLYGKGYYNSKFATPDDSYFIYHSLSAPLVPEILNMRDRGLITVDQANSQIAALANNDSRKDLTKYIQRNAALYSSNIAVSGGSKQIAYRMSAGYDKSLNNTVTSAQDRFNINSNVNIKLLKNLDLQTGILYTQTNNNDQSAVNIFNESGYRNGLMPYDKIADINGNPLSIIKAMGVGNGFRPGYVDTVSNLLDMHYKPLQDIYDGYTKTNASDINLNLNATYRFNPALSANLIYGFQNTKTNSADYQSVNSYFSRYFINYFTSDPTAVNPYYKNFPLGGINSPTTDQLTGHTFRGQLNFNKTWGNHNLAAVAGAAVFMSKSLTRTDLYPGYNENTLIYQRAIDYKTPMPVFAPGATQDLSILSQYYQALGINDNIIRTTKAYFNAAYTYKNLYTLSGSIAKDQSNIFGADANKSFKPYYSSGLRWNINNEEFYKLSWLPVLALRATFGYNGNLNYTYKPNAYLLYDPQLDYNSNLAFGNITGGTNRLLRPEKTGQLNLGLDFGLRNNRITGNIEVYEKWNSDLIGPNNIDQTTGFVTQFYNTANMKGRGVDIIINSINLKSQDFSWTSSARFSYNKVKITKVFLASNANGITTIGNNPFDLTFLGTKFAGADVNSIYAYKWAGLSPVNGAPQGYLNGVPSTNYFGMFAGSGSAKLDAIVRVGSASPLYYGSLRNTFSYKNLSITANILYKLGYYFRKNPSYSVNYLNVGSTGYVLPAEYSNRWQKPGDEAFTNVPAFIYPFNFSSDTFYQNAEINVLRADHIRLQDVSLFYSFNKRGILKNMTVYGNVQDLGILWRANKQGIDPDALDIPRPRVYALGINKTF